MQKLTLSDCSKHDDKQSITAIASITEITEEIVDDVRLSKMLKVDSTNDKKQMLGVLQKLPLEVISSIISFATADEWLNWLRVSSWLHRISSRTTSIPHYWVLDSTNIDQLATKKVRSLRIGQSVTSLKDPRKEFEMVGRQSQLEQLVVIFNDAKNY